MKVAVVGAGISGLSTHWYLERLAREQGRPVEVETWDPRSTPGGNMRTLRQGGWRCEEAAESILNSRLETRALAREIGIDDRIVQVSPLARKRFLVWQGRLRAMGPASIFGNFPTWKAKLGALREPFVARGPEDETFAEFGRRRLGSGLFEQIMDPMVTGIYAADPEKLSIRSAFPRIKALEMEHGSLLRGLWRRRANQERTAEQGKVGSGSYSFRDGMSDLVQGLARALSGPVKTGISLQAMEALEGGRWRLIGAGGESGVFDRVVLALPSHQLGGLSGVGADLCRVLGSVPYNQVAVVGLGFHRNQVAHPLDGFGFLVPRLERRRILGTLFTSSLWDGVAPPDHVLLRTMVGGGRDPHLAMLDEEALAELVRAELAQLLGIQGAPVFVHVRRHERGIPQYPVGHHLVAAQLRQKLSGVGVWIAGNAWDGIGVNDCVAASLPRAREILESDRAS